MSTQGIVKGTATAGTTHTVATYEISESGARQVQRNAINDPDGNNITAGSTQTAPVSVSLPTANTAVIAVATGAKVGWLIHNISDTDVYIGFHSTTSTSIGIRIFPGGSYQQQGIGMFTGNVYAVCGTSSKTIRVQQW